ncbi:hypothetical protein PCK1_002222 [Pneumocystis canis]|nr:hypothetical protein PCK1_002222 [Pneumocystis canis]
MHTGRITGNEGWVSLKFYQSAQDKTSIETLRSSTYLVLTSLNETFEGKCLLLPLWPQTLRMGRQTSARTVPTPRNGYFDSKVLSRVHAEVWADEASHAVIRDTQSSNGTFLNGQRLSAENQMSEPVILHVGDILEFGIDILNEENLNSIQKTFLQDQKDEPLASMDKHSCSSVVNLDVLAVKQLEIEEKMTKIQQLETEQQYEETYRQICKQMIDALVKEKSDESEKMLNRVEEKHNVKENENEKDVLSQQAEMKKEDSDSELKMLQHMLETTKQELEIWKYRAKMTENIVEQSTHHVAALLKASETQTPCIQRTDDCSFRVDPWVLLLPTCCVVIGISIMIYLNSLTFASSSNHR